MEQAASEQSKEFIRKFEDFPSEIFYEIFQFLNFFHLYQSFFNLNQRFRNLLTDSRLLINFDFSPVSKRTFQFYYTNILIPYEHQIECLHLPNVFILNRIFSPSYRSFQFTRLKELSLTVYKTISLATIFTRLTSLSQLLYLTVKAEGKRRIHRSNYDDRYYFPYMSWDRVTDNDNLIEESSSFPSVPFQSLQHLVLDYPISLNELKAVLSIVPEVRFLSLEDLEDSSNGNTKLKPISLHRLKHLSLKLKTISFSQFQSMVKNLFKQVRNLSVTVEGQKEYFNGNQWKELISFHMPYLRVLDIFVSFSHCGNATICELNKSIDQFNDVFWYERKWYFEHFMDESIVLYSTNPFRRKELTLYDRVEGNLHTFGEKNLINSVHRLNIQSKQAMIACPRYFPNVTEVKISNCAFEHSFFTTLRNIASLERLTKVDISGVRCSFSDITELLFNAENIQTLTIDFHVDYSELRLLERNNRFHFGSKKNQVRKLTIKREISMDMVKIIISYFIRLEHLEINGYLTRLKQVLRFLLKQTNMPAANFSSLRVHDNNGSISDLARSEGLNNDPSIHLEKEDNSTIYLWW